MEEYLKRLEGITYPEWAALSFAVDKAFDQKKGEFEKTLKFARAEDAMKIIRSQFEGRWG